MPLIDDKLKEKLTAQERKLRFEEFVKEQKAAGKKGMRLACLQTQGHRDFYGTATFGRGLYQSKWIFQEGDNPKVLLYPKKKEAEDYAKELQKLLKDNGYPGSRAWVQEVVLRTIKTHPYSALVMPEEVYSPDERYIICMKVK